MPEFLPPVSSSSTTDYYRPVEVFVVQPPKQRYWLHIVLLLATIFTTLVVGARMEFNFQHNQPPFYSSDDSLSGVFPLTWALQSSHILLGIPFCCTLILFFLAHEMGHYLCCRYYGVHATLPFFIPFPTFFGTMGAVILIRSSIRSRTALFDIGIAGPIAGFAVATILMFLALPFSKLLPAGTSSEIQFGYPLVFRLAWLALPLASRPWRDWMADGKSSSHSDCSLDRHVRNLAQLAAGRPTRRWAHYLFPRSPRAQNGIAPDNSRAYSHGALFLGGMVDLGGAAADQRHAASHGGRVAGGDGRATMDCGVRSRDADPYIGASAFRAQLIAASLARPAVGTVTGRAAPA